MEGEGNVRKWKWEWTDWGKKKRKNLMAKVMTDRDGRPKHCDANDDGGTRGEERL